MPLGFCWASAPGWFVGCWSLGPASINRSLSTIIDQYQSLFATIFNHNQRSVSVVNHQEYISQYVSNETSIHHYYPLVFSHIQLIFTLVLLLSVIVEPSSIDHDGPQQRKHLCCRQTLTVCRCPKSCSKCSTNLQKKGAAQRWKVKPGMVKGSRWGLLQTSGLISVGSLILNQKHFNISTPTIDVNSFILTQLQLMLFCLYHQHACFRESIWISQFIFWLFHSTRVWNMTVKQGDMMNLQKQRCMKYLWFSHGVEGLGWACRTGKRQSVDDGILVRWQGSHHIVCTTVLAPRLRCISTGDDHRWIMMVNIVVQRSW